MKYLADRIAAHAGSGDALTDVMPRTGDKPNPWLGLWCCIK